MLSLPFSKVWRQNFSVSDISWFKGLTPYTFIQSIAGVLLHKVKISMNAMLLKHKVKSLPLRGISYEFKYSFSVPMLSWLPISNISI